MKSRRHIAAAGGGHVVMNRRFERHPYLASRTIDGVVVLVPVQRSGPDVRRLYRLKDPVAVKIWELVDRRKAVCAMHRSLCREFDAEPGKMKRDLVKFLEQLASIGAIRPARPQ